MTKKVAELTLDEFRQVIKEEVHDEVPSIVAMELGSFWEHNLRPYLDNLEGRFNGLENKVDTLSSNVDRLVNQHSVEILELKARVA